MKSELEKTMIKPLISIIVPVYNVEKYLDECVRSLIEQSYTNLEILLVDDGSLDSSGRICDRWKREDQRITVIHQQNGGLSDARNSGLLCAKGQLIAFVDSDDVIHSTMYEKLYNVMLETDCDISSCEILSQKEFHKEDFEGQNICKIKEYSAEEALREIIDNRDIYVTVWNKLYRRSIIDGIMFERGKYHEDEYWTYQIIARAKKIAMISQYYYGYRQRDNSIMTQQYSLRHLDLLDARNRRQQFIREKFPGLADRDCCRLRFECIRALQLSMKYLDKKDLQKSREIIKDIVKKNPLRYAEYKNLPAGKKTWCFLSNLSFTGTCYIRNWLRFGP